MSDAVVVLSTCASRDEAERIANALVNDRLAACVQLLPPIQSIYRWQGAVERAEEILILIKSTSAQFPRLEQRIMELHSYETPEIIAIPVVAGAAKYLAWLRETLKPIN
ncbi:MAG TPA: divalent-cation tolerance protein CutA [Bryobacteraceae bacterium]|nr:divalent-cation tolerance protein CutA [Bryobacteraceae bacterium]